jgi:hypothetical protein
VSEGSRNDIVDGGDLSQSLKPGAELQQPLAGRGLEQSPDIGIELAHNVLPLDRILGTGAPVWRTSKVFVFGNPYNTVLATKPEAAPSSPQTVESSEGQKVMAFQKSGK